jgi:hypothetical protein
MMDEVISGRILRSKVTVDGITSRPFNGIKLFRQLILRACELT